MIAWIKRRMPDSVAGWFVWITTWSFLAFAAFMLFVLGPELQARDLAERVQSRSEAYWFAQTCLDEGKTSTACISACRDSAWFEACRGRVSEIVRGK